MKAPNFVTVKPQDPQLRTVISYYYFHNMPASAGLQRFCYYPNYKNALTIYKDAQVKFAPHFSKVQPEKGHYSFLYSGVQSQVRTAEMMTPFRKIGIVFQELGLNHFTEVSLSELCKDCVELTFDYFGTPLIDCCDAVHDCSELEDKVSLLDAFFIERFHTLELPKLKAAIKYIIDAHDKVSVKDVCNALNIHRKTLLRMFQKHLCCSVKEYIDIVHFRKALNAYLLENPGASLTQIAIGQDYYDQSQFISHFKKLTGINPKSFFKSIQHLGEEDTFWNFE